MNGLEIEFLLGIFFFVTGLSVLVVPTGEKRGAVVTFVAGVLLLVLVFVKKSLFGV